MIRRALAAYPTLLRVGFAEAVAYRLEFLIWILTTNMPLVMLALWSAVASEAPVGRFGQADFTAYYLGTLLVRLLTGSWVVWELNTEIRQGTLALRLLRPLHPMVAYSAENLAALPLRGLLTIPLVGILLWLSGQRQLTHDPALLGLFFASVIFAWLLNFLAMAAIGSLGLVLESSVSLFELWLGFYSVLSGYLIPLELFPAWLRAICDALPFRFMLGFPVEVLVSHLTRAQALAGFGVQVAYCMGFAAAGAVIWRVGLRRYQAYGG